MKSPRQAVDYPNLPDHLFICWRGNGRKWPDAGRQNSFLSATKTNALFGCALFTAIAEDAATFNTESEAKAWLADHEAKRPHPYGVTISTVAQMKAACGYSD